MAQRIEKFEDFVAWQKARELTRAIYRITNLPAFSRDFGLKDQIRRSAVSIMSNIAEGFERGGPSYRSRKRPALNFVRSFMWPSMQSTSYSPTLKMSWRPLLKLDKS